MNRLITLWICFLPMIFSSYINANTCFAPKTMYGKECQTNVVLEGNFSTYVKYCFNVTKEWTGIKCYGLGTGFTEIQESQYLFLGTMYSRHENEEHKPNYLGKSCSVRKSKPTHNSCAILPWNHNSVCSTFCAGVVDETSYTYSCEIFVKNDDLFVI